MTPRRVSVALQASLRHLWQRHIHRRCPRSRDALIEYYGYLVTKTRQRILPSVPVRIHPEDLDQEGQIALIKAVDNFDLNRHVKFESYAISMIRGAMLEYLRKEDWVPRSVRSKQKLIRGAEEELSLSLGAENVSDTDLAGHLRMTLDGFYKLYSEAHVLQLVSLEDVVGDSEHDDLDPLMVLEAVRSGDPEPFLLALTSSQQEALFRCIGWLTPQEQAVIVLYYFRHMTLKDIARLIARSESRAHQLHSQAIKRLRRFLSSQRGLWETQRTVAARARLESHATAA